jgi:hypothetical protein
MGASMPHHFSMQRFQRTYIQFLVGLHLPTFLLSSVKGQFL